MGLGYRFEHHFRAQGVWEIDGTRRDFKAVGTRIHRAKKLLRRQLESLDARRPASANAAARGRRRAA